MANYNCDACNELREDAPNLIVNGLTNTECASLKNNTGLNPSSGNDDCTDLDNMNDCLIGNMEQEIDAYDVCDWKDFMRKFIDNAWTVFKAIICAICGIWTNIKNLWSAIAALKKRDAELCELIDQAVQPLLAPYGILPLADTETLRSHRCGTATNKVHKLPDDGSLNPYIKNGQNIGIAYASLTKESCTSDAQEMIEWIAPSHLYYELVAGAESGDVLWKISKSEAQSVIGISDYLWNLFSESSWIYRESALAQSRQTAWLEIVVGDTSVGLASNEMGIVFRGCSAPNEPITTNQWLAAFNPSFARAYKHTI